MNGDISKVLELDENKITEEATHAWYKNDAALHPYDGEQEPNYTGLQDGQSIDAHGKEAHTKVLDTQGKYTWIKAPRYDGKPLQVGPLANIVVNYAKKNERVVKVVDQFLKDAGLPLEAVFSTLGRTACRMIEAKVVADNGLIALENLIANIKSGDTQTCAK